MGLKKEDAVSLCPPSARLDDDFRGNVLNFVSCHRLPVPTEFRSDLRLAEVSGYTQAVTFYCQLISLSVMSPRFIHLNNAKQFVLALDGVLTDCRPQSSADRQMPGWSGGRPH